MPTRDAENVVGLYQRHARAWAEARGTRLFERAWLDRFRALLPDHAAVLDIGCGSGEPIARYLLEQRLDVTDVDSSPQMIGLCEARFPDQDWLVADMRTLSLDRAFNGILAWDSLFHLSRDDQRGMFRIFRKHSASRAAVMFTSGPADGEAIGILEGERLSREPRRCRVSRPAERERL